MRKITFKKLLGVFMAVAMLLSVFVPAQVFAANAAVAVTGPTEVVAGQENTFAINVTGNPGFSGFNITVGFDANMYEYVKATNGSYVMTYDLPSAANNGECVIAAMSGDNVSGDGTLANVVLKTKDGASGSSEVTVKVNELFDADMNDISASTTNLSTQVKTTPDPDPTPTPDPDPTPTPDPDPTPTPDPEPTPTPVTTATVSVQGPSSVNGGSNADFAVKIANNPGFAGFRITMNYDVNKFEFVKASNGSYSCTYDLPDSNTTGKLIMAGMSSDDLKNDGTLANVTLKVKTDVSGDSTISVSVDELFNADMDNISVTTKNHSIHIEKTDSPAYSVSFEGGSGATGSAPSKISDKKYGEKFSLPKNTYTKDGYTFTGWNDGKKTYKAGSTYTMPNYAVKFTAQWEEDEDTNNSKGGGGKSSSKASSETTTKTVTESATENTTSSNVKPNADTPAIAGEVRISIGSANANVGGKTYTMDVVPYIQASSSSTLVPLRFVAVAICGENVDNPDNSNMVTWNGSTKTATITTKGKVITFTDGSPYMVVNGKSIMMDNNVKAEIKDSRMFIPFRALGNALDVSVDWDANTKTAIYKMK